MRDVMDSQQFVDALRVVVRDGAVSEELNVLKKPPGRQPPENLKENAAWYNALDDEQKRILSVVLHDVVDRAVFGILCVLDGARAIESDGDKGRLELHYVKNGSVLLNSPEGELLHELW
jgi:hypothetical protein